MCHCASSWEGKDMPRTIATLWLVSLVFEAQPANLQPLIREMEQGRAAIFRELEAIEGPCFNIGQHLSACRSSNGVVNVTIVTPGWGCMDFVQFIPVSKPEMRLECSPTRSLSPSDLYRHFVTLQRVILEKMEESARIRPQKQSRAL